MKLPLRLRLALLFTAGFGVLLLIAGIGLHQWLATDYRSDFDRQLYESIEAFEALHLQERRMYPTSWAAAEHALTELLYPDRIFIARHPDGRLAASRGLGEDLPAEAFVSAAREPTPQDVRVADRSYRVAGMDLTDGVLGIVALDRASLDRRLRYLKTVLWAGLPLILMLGGGLGALGSRQALAPVIRVARAARRVSGELAAGSHSFTNLPMSTTRDEVAVLTSSFQDLVDRLSTALRRERTSAEQQREFLANAAHEMRMPVTILRTEAEVALTRPADIDGDREALRRVRNEAEGLSELVNDLLLIARADDGQQRPDLRRVFLDDLASHVLSRIRAHPAARNRVIRVGDFESAPTLGDAILLERAIGVLLHNALVHAAPAAVEVATGCDGEMAWVSVRDEGPGIPAASRERIFERFVRLDSKVPGTGLGLPIARWVATIHGGRLELECPAQGGSRFTVRVPVAAGTRVPAEPRRVPSHAP